MGAKELGYDNIVGKFYLALEELAKADWVGKIAMPFQSDQPQEEYKWLGMVPQMREWIGGKNATGLKSNGITVVNKWFEATLPIALDDLRRDKTGQIDMRIRDLAKRALTHWKYLMSLLITNGTGNTNGLCYDGQFFFDDDHLEGASGTQKNLLAAGDVATLNVGTATAPTPAEAAAAILGVIAYMMGIKDNQGEPINDGAESFLVMTSPALMGPFRTALSAELLASGVSNVLVNQSDLKIELAINARLAYTTQFAVFRTDAPAKPLIQQEETPVEIKILGEDSDHAFHKKEILVSAEASRNVAYGLWQYAAHATMS